MPTAFISYSHHDRDFVQRLAPDLERAGLEVWWDQELEGGDAFVEAIHDALGKVNYLLLVLSPHSVESEWIKQEMNVALMRTLDRQMTGIIPLLLKDCPIPLAVADLQYVDFRGPHEPALQELLRALGGSAEEFQRTKALKSSAADRSGRLREAPTVATTSTSKPWLVQVKGSSHIYLVDENRTRHWIPDRDTLQAQAAGTPIDKLASWRELARFAPGRPLPSVHQADAPWLVRVRDARRVYWIDESHTRHWIPDLETLQSVASGAGVDLLASWEELQAFRPGRPLASVSRGVRPWLVTVHDDPRVYYMDEDGTRHWIPNGPTLESFASWDDIDVLAGESELEEFSPGPPLPSIINP